MTITNCLNLFSCVPFYGDTSEEFRIKTKFGIIISPGALFFEEEILDWARNSTLSGEQLNKSFYDSWQKCESVNLAKQFSDQALHYFSTYGLEALGFSSPDFIYLPERTESQWPSKVGLKIIKAVEQEEILERCVKLLEGAALTQETILQILSVMERLNFDFTNFECRNREATILIADKFGILPSKADDLFRFLVFKATAETLVIKNPKLIGMIKASKYELPKFTQQQMISLAGSFNRYKPLWLGFKAACSDNRATVNRLAKLSKKFHAPLPVNVLASVTHRVFSPFEITQAAQKATTEAIVRAINACKQYAVDDSNRLYRIRNGKTHTTQKLTSLSAPDLVKVEMLLTEILQKRITAKEVFQPKHISYPMPTSEKNFIGNFPTGTKVSIPASDEYLLVGIYWDTYQCDIDLSSISCDAKIGWNSSWKGDNEQLMYSGDVTRGPAAEWLYCKAISKNYLVQVNLYNGAPDQKFKLILGYGSAPDREYMIDPNKVIFEAELQFEEGKSELILGLLTPSKEGTDFYLANMSSGSSRISSNSDRANIQRQALIKQVTNMLQIDEICDVVDNLEEEVVDLSANQVNKDTLLALLK